VNMMCNEGAILFRLDGFTRDTSLTLLSLVQNDIMTATDSYRSRKDHLVGFPIALVVIPLGF
jgi:hypothetical protein